MPALWSRLAPANRVSHALIEARPTVDRSADEHRLERLAAHLRLDANEIRPRRHLLPVVVLAVPHRLVLPVAPDLVEEGGGRIVRAPAQGGRPVPVCSLSDRVAGGVGASWANDGKVYFSTGTAGIHVVSALGGEAREFIPPGEGIGDLHEPVVLPGKGGVLAIVHPENGRPGILGLYRDGELRTLLDHADEGDLRSLSYDPRGYILFYMWSGDSLRGIWALQFDLESGTVSGDPILIESEATGASVAQNGTLAYVNSTAGNWQVTINRVDLGGAVGETLFGPHPGFLEPRLSPDGSRLAIELWISDQQRGELRVVDLVRGTESILQRDDRWLSEPSWSADGNTLWYGAWDRENAEYSIWSVPADGSRAPALFGNSDIVALTSDRRSMIQHRSRGSDRLVRADRDTVEVWLVSLEDPDQQEKLPIEMSRASIHAISPSGDYALCRQFGDGTSTIYLTRFPSFESRWQIASDRRIRDCNFDPSGSAIYFATEDGMHRVLLEEEQVPILGRAEKLFPFEDWSITRFDMDTVTGGFIASVRRSNEDVSESAPGIRLVENWEERLDGI